MTKSGSIITRTKQFVKATPISTENYLINEMMKPTDIKQMTKLIKSLTHSPYYIIVRLLMIQKARGKIQQ